MATETELKLSLSPQDASKLKSHPRLTALPSQSRLLRNTYYDTPGCNLVKLGVAVRFRQIGQQWLLTVKSGEPASGGLAKRSEWEAPATPGQFDFSFVEVDGLRQRLEALTPALEPIFTTHFHRTTWRVESEGTLIEVALDRGRIRAGDRHQSLCEVEMELIDGDIAGIFTLASALQADIPLRPMVASKAERGYALGANRPSRPFKSPCPPVDETMTPTQAFRTIAFHCLEHLQRNEMFGPTRDDPEFVHQARVALRRLRAALRLFTPILPESILAYGAVWKVMAATLGEVRNWDIFTGETLVALAADFPGNPEIARLQRGSRQQMAKARREVRQLFSSSDYGAALLSFSGALATLPETTDMEIRAFAQARLDDLGCKAKRRARQEQDDESWHKLRIRLKELRYALEFFSSLLPHRHLKSYADALVRIQNEFGQANDHRTGQQLLCRLGARNSGQANAWVSGRAALLKARLPEAVKQWQNMRAPWK